MLFRYIETIVVILILFLFTPPKNTSAQVLINEFNPKTPEWVEFMNIGSNTFNLSELVFDDDTDLNSDEGNSAKKSMQGLLPSNSMCYMELPSFLNDSGDSPSIIALNGDIVDTYTYASSSAGLSYSRIPDGGAWQVETSYSQTATSCSSLPTPTPEPTETPTQEPTNEPTDEPTARPTKTSTPRPSATPTRSPTPKPSSTPTQTPVESETPEATDHLAGDVEPSFTPHGQVAGVQTATSGVPLVALLTIVGGLGFMAVGGIGLYKKTQKQYNGDNG